MPKTGSPPGFEVCVTHLFARRADSLTMSSFGVFAALTSMRDLVDGAAADSHDAVMMHDGGTKSSADSALLIHMMIESQCLAFDLERRWQSGPRPPILHFSDKDLAATGGTKVHDAVQMIPYNPDITLNERSGR